MVFSMIQIALKQYDIDGLSYDINRPRCFMIVMALTLYHKPLPFYLAYDINDLYEMNVRPIGNLDCPF